MHRTRAASLLLSAACLAVGAGLVGCSGPEDRSDGRYCTEVGNHLDELNRTVFATPADIDAMVAGWKAVSDHAPLAIQPEWAALVAEVQLAATLDVSKPDDLQRLVDQARRTEPAANAVIDYTQRICGVTIGKVKPVVTTTTPATTPATTVPGTTVPATSTKP